MRKAKFRCEHGHTGDEHPKCYAKAEFPEAERNVFLGDLHVPFEDKKTLELILEFIEEWQPHRVWLLGDIIDNYPISRFNKDPQRINTLQEDCDKTHEILKQLRKKAKYATIDMLEGNHEARLTKLLWSNAPALANLRCLTIKNLLGLEDLGIHYTEGFVEHKNLIILHGERIRQHSGWSAKAHFEKFGDNGIAGHSHRGGQHLVTQRDDTNVWYENYCLCDLHPEYDPNPNWQQGFTIGYFLEDRFMLTPIPIVKHKFLVEGSLYE